MKVETYLSGTVDKPIRMYRVSKGRKTILLADETTAKKLVDELVFAFKIYDSEKELE